MVHILHPVMERHALGLQLVNLRPNGPHALSSLRRRHQLVLDLLNCALHLANVHRHGLQRVLFLRVADASFRLVCLVCGGEWAGWSGERDECREVK